MIATAMAERLIAGPDDYASSFDRLSLAAGADRAWLAALCSDLLRRFRPLDAADSDAIAAFIETHEAFRQAFQSQTPPRLGAYLPGRPVMAQAPDFLAGRHLPQLPTPGELAQWLGLSTDELDWFADLERRNRQPQGPLTHYRYRWQAKATSGHRLLETPKFRLKSLQRQILHGLLERIAPHDAAHGFRRGRSCLTHADLHTGKACVLRLDLRDFFLSIPAGRIVRLWQSLGYPLQSARILAALCTHAAPLSATARGPGAWRDRHRYTAAHLPQGAPTSPALANLCAYALDRRLTALAERLGLRYSRYADDIALSGDTLAPRDVPALLGLIGRIADEEGFHVHPAKTRIMPAHRRQQVTGLVVNQRLNVARPAFDALKAILHNCVRYGPTSQNRDGHPDFRAHLMGRISHLAQTNPQRGRRLWVVFERIAW